MYTRGPAGFERSISPRGGQLFGAASFIEPALCGLLQKLPRETDIHGTDPQWFSRRAGFYLGEINAVHPYREGNGRTQREFIREPALQAGFAIDWSLPAELSNRRQQRSG
jgi:cell filamentation protein